MLIHIIKQDLNVEKAEKEFTKRPKTPGGYVAVLCDRKTAKLPLCPHLNC